MPTGTAPIARALVQTLRAATALQAELTGGEHEGVAPVGTREPWLVYSLHYAPWSYVWGSVDLQPGFDVCIFSHDQVQARNLDQLVINALWDAPLNVDGQTTLFCRRTLDISSGDIGADGKKIYMAGGIYEIWTSQDL